MAKRKASDKAVEAVESSTKVPSKRARVDVDDAAAASSLSADVEALTMEVSVKGPRRAAVFGSGECAQLGLGDSLVERKFPMFVGRGTPLFDDDVDVSFVSSGGLHNAVVSSQGHVFTWGCNDEKALGRAGDEWIAGRVEYLAEANVHVVKVSCGDSHTLALTKDGQVYAWGAYRDERGMMGFSKSTSKPCDIPTLISLPSSRRRIVDIASGVNHSLLLDDSGDIFEWGHVRLGQRVVSRSGLLRPRLVNVRRFGRVRKVFAGHYQSWALTTDGRVFAWGLNQYGQAGVGDDSENQLHRPIEVATLRGENVLKLSGGLHHSMALTADGRVFSFGRNNYGELGLGNLAERRTPTHVQDLTDCVDIACGTSHSVAIDKDGKAYSCGFGTMLQLGSGESEDRLSFEPVAGKMLESYVASNVAAGAQHSLIIVQQLDN